MENSKTNSVGVIIGRFQGDQLHAGQLELITSVMRNHNSVAILLGEPPIKNRGRKDPLSYRDRIGLFDQFMQSETSSVSLHMLPDVESDEEWSANLDTLVKTLFPTKKIILYGGKDSFIPTYTGNLNTKQVDTLPGWDGTDLREVISSRERNSPDFRAGKITATLNRFAVSYQVVDVAMVDYKKETVVMGGKKLWGNYYGFPGGFVSPTDGSLEIAAARELHEETRKNNICSSEMRYLGSTQIVDWRYKHEDRILSAMFVIDASTTWGKLQAGDDLDQVYELPINEETRQQVRPSHQPLWDLLIKHMNAKKENKI
jgi:bifunctional NMN adenylyltransferase/nudix hydrolase